MTNGGGGRNLWASFICIWELNDKIALPVLMQPRPFRMVDRKVCSNNHQQLFRPRRWDRTAVRVLEECSRAAEDDPSTAEEAFSTHGAFKQRNSDAKGSFGKLSVLARV